MTSKESFNVSEIEDDLPIKGMALSGFALLAGLGGTFLFWMTPSASFVSSLGVLGMGMMGIGIFNMIRKQNELRAVDLFPYVFWVSMAIVIVAFGVAGQYIHPEVGLTFLILVSVTILVLGQFFNFHAPEHVIR